MMSFIRKPVSRATMRYLAVRLFILAFCVNFLAGCGILWAPPGASDEDWKKMQAEKRRTLAEQRQSAPDNSILSAFAAVAQGLANSGGKNAPQYQAAATAFNPTAANQGSRSSLPLQNTANPTSTITTAGGKDLYGNRPSEGDSYEPDANGCISFANNGTFMFLVNSCGYKVAVKFCFTGTGVRSSKCGGPNSAGLEWVQAHSRATIAGPMMDPRNAPYRSHVFACKDPAEIKVTISENGMRGGCKRTR